MTSLQAAAHLKLISMLPVRTHLTVDDSPRGGGGRVRTDEEVAAMRRRVFALISKGWRVPRISKHLQVSRQTIYNYLRKDR